MSRSINTRPTESRFSRRSFLRVAIGSAFAPAFTLGLQRGPARITATDLNGLFLFQGAGCNVVAMRGEEGALMIDGGVAANADALLKAVKDRTGSRRIQTLINTHWHPEQTGSNEAASRDNAVIFAHEKTQMYLSNTVTSVTFQGRLSPLPLTARPNKTTRGDGSLEFGGQRIDYG